MQTKQIYFALDAEVELVRGALRGALYNFRSGDVYSIDEVSANLLANCETGLSVQEISRAMALPYENTMQYLAALSDKNLGQISDQPLQCHAKPRTMDANYPDYHLEFLWLELTEGCNLRCRHCYSTSSPEAGKLDQMVHEDWLRVISEGRQLGCSRLQFIGGEPFLYGERLFELADHAKAEGYTSLEVFTNGTLIRQSFIEALLERNMSVAVSLYGPNASVHNLVTLTEMSFRRTSETLKLLRSSGVPVRVAIIAMNVNQATVDETERYVRDELGIEQVGIDIIRPSGRGCDINLQATDTTLLRRFELRKPQFPKIDRATFIDRHRGHNCFSTDLCVTATGDVFPCIMERSGSLGNLLLSSLNAIWHSAAAQEYQGLTKDQIEVCRDCEYRYACFDCRPKAAKAANGNLLAKPAWCYYDPYSGRWGSDES